MFGITTVHLIHMLTVIKNILIERFVIFWKRRMLSDETMKMFCTYKVSKQNFGIESYIDDIYDKTVRKCLSSFRISAHRIRIERGRYFGEKKKQKKDYVLHVMLLKMKFTFCVNVISTQVKRKYFMTVYKS